MYKVVNNSIPVELPSYLTFHNGSRLRNSHMDNLCLVSSVLPSNYTSSVYSNLFNKNFFLRTYCLWNNVPYDIRGISSYDVFETQIKSHIWGLARLKFVCHDDGG